MQWWWYLLQEKKDKVPEKNRRGRMSKQQQQQQCPTSLQDSQQSKERLALKIRQMGWQPFPSNSRRGESSSSVSQEVKRQILLLSACFPNGLQERLPLLDWNLPSPRLAEKERTTCDASYSHVINKQTRPDRRHGHHARRGGEQRT